MGPAASQDEKSPVQRLGHLLTREKDTIPDGLSSTFFLPPQPLMPYVIPSGDIAALAINAECSGGLVGACYCFQQLHSTTTMAPFWPMFSSVSEAGPSVN